MTNKPKVPTSLKVLSIILICIGILILVVNVFFPDKEQVASCVFSVVYILMGIGLLLAFKAAWFSTIVLILVMLYQIPFNPIQSSFGVGLIVACLPILLSDKCMKHFNLNTKSRTKLIFIVLAISFIAFPLLVYTKAIDI